MTPFHPRSLRATVGAALVVALVTGCAATRGPAPEAFATAVIENDAPRAVTVYALRDGMRVRVGRVESLSTAELQLRADMAAPGGRIQLGVMPMGSRRLYAGTPIHIEPGDVVHLTVGGLLR